MNSDEFGFYNYINDPNNELDLFGLAKSYNQGDMPTWMPGKRAHERHHIIPKSLRDHPLFARAGMDIHGSSNMMYLPMFDGMHPTKATHRHFKIGGENHSDYNRSMSRTLDDMNQQAISENWDTNRTQREVLDLQSQARNDLNNGVNFW